MTSINNKYSIQNSITTIHTECEKVEKSRNKKLIKKALAVIHNSSSKIANLNYNERIHLRKDFKELSLMTWTKPINELLKKCLNSTYKVPKEVYKHTGFFSDAVNKSQKLIEMGIKKGEINAKDKSAVIRHYTEKTLKKAIEDQVKSNMPGGIHPIYLLRESSSVKSKGNLKYFVITSTKIRSKTIMNLEVQHHLCAYDLKTKKWGRCQYDKVKLQYILGKKQEKFLNPLIYKICKSAIPLDLAEYSLYDFVKSQYNYSLD